MNEKILFVYTGGHEVHKKFAKTVTNNFQSFSLKLSKNYDIYFTEGVFAPIILLKKFGLINRKARIITLFSDPRLFYLNIKKRFNFKKNKIGKIETYPKLKLLLAKKLINRLDYVICVGKFEKNLFRRINKTTPCKVVYPFISNKKYKKLVKISPNLKTHNIVFVGNGPDYYYKGLDFLIKVFKEIKKKIPDAKLYVIGNWEIKKEWKAKNVYFLGHQKNIIPHIKSSSLYLHPGRGEAFGVTVLEAMLAGVPAIVSDMTGAKEIVSKVNKSMVVPLNKKIAAGQIIKYFKLNLKLKQKLSKKSKELARQFDENKMLRRFKRVFLKLVNKKSVR